MDIYQQTKLFLNREDAGKQLGRELRNRFESDTLLLGVPRGGVEIAFYAAKVMYAEFSVVVSKKLGFPGQPELGFGALAEEGFVYVSEMGKKKLNKEIIERVIEEKKIEVKRRVNQYRNGKNLPDMTGKTVIITDDGIATGATLVPVIDLCKSKGADKVVVAAPVAPSSTLALLSGADDIVVLVTPEPFYAVGQFYDDFHNMTDEEVFVFLKEGEII